MNNKNSLPIFMNTCATIELNPVALRLVSVIADQQRFTGTVATIVVADLCGGWSDRTVRWYLAQAEAAGIVHRPRGVKSGWAVLSGTGMVSDESRARRIRKESGGKSISTFQSAGG